MTRGEPDPALRRFERDTVGAALVLTAAAALLAGATGGLALAVRVGLGVLGGGLLVALSYRAIKGAADLLVVVAVRAGQNPSEAAPAPEDGDGAAEAVPAPVLSSGRRAFHVVKFFTRYALLAVAAYVMLTCFRLHPVGVLLGVTSPFAAALVQLARLAGGRERQS